MCDACRRPSRRNFLASAGFGLAAAGLLLQPARAAGAKTDLTADQALDKLKEGNARYLKEPQLCVSNLAADRGAGAKGQAPWATILTCADSRLAPEILFGGLDLGEIFVTRNAGNIADPYVMGSIEYGAEHLGSPLVVVLGHSACGACAAACEYVENKTAFPGDIATVVDAIAPAAKSQLGKPGDFVDNTVRENARLQAARIQSSAIIAHLAHGGLKVVYAHYDLESGEVAFLG